ncbi:succinylglutamate desuccinylase/aspartoacylase family protein [Patescibacteria group bacterium]|nr:succinylglutamate desuccinylase/aspartoacylase family protein [Patescibacteria group bacterium]
MRNFLSKPIVIIGLVVLLLGGLIGSNIYRNSRPVVATVPQVKIIEKAGPIVTVIGKSVQGRTIDAYTYGKGKTHIAFVGGVHGAYEWNSIVLAFKVIDYLNSNPSSVPKSLTVTVIPDANPDGVFKIIGKEGRFTEKDIPSNISTIPGRFNANTVDLNRNFDCKWQPESTWQNKTESAGTKPFSEPEAEAIRAFVEKDHPVAMVFWHSKSGAVYASQCKNGILPETLKIMNAYAKASGYNAVPVFSAYVTTGDSEGWLASIGIPAITVEMTTHETIELEKNLAGIKALFEYYK